MLKGSSSDVVSENIRLWRSNGLSESDAIEKANKAHGGDGSAVSREDSPPSSHDPQGRQFVIVTKDFSGLGYALALTREGNQVTIATCCPEDDPKEIATYEKVAQGLVPTMTLDEAVKSLQSDQTYWIFAENIEPKVADKLRSRGQKVFGTGALSEKMEHDRQYAVDIANKAGLKSPLTEEFSSRDEGVAFLESNPEKAFVFKPDNGQTNYSTFVPVRGDDADANKETLIYLKQMTKEPGTYVLQERIRGTEVDVEAWFYEGEPFFAIVTLEAKRKDSGELGEMSGCAGDVVWVTPVESEIVKQTIGKLFPFYRNQQYTGFADVNVIITSEGPKFLEVCNRFGYNGHVTLFLGMAKGPIGDILADYMDANIWDMESRFREDCGGSLTLFLDHPREGLPLHIDPKFESQFYPFDSYQDDEDEGRLLAGYSTEVGIFADHGSSPEAALTACLSKIRDDEAVSFPDIYYRTDLAAQDHANNIIGRYRELEAMGLA